MEDPLRSEYLFIIARCWYASASLAARFRRLLLLMTRPPMTRTTTTAPAAIPIMSPMLLGAGVTGPLADSASEGFEAVVVTGSELLESK